MNFDKEYKIRKELIENYISDDIKIYDSLYKNVLEAMNYSTMLGGKRIRPVLMYSCYELFKSDAETILPFCAAIEYIHTYSLIHDDLPCMDNDDLRRGMPTCHKKFNETIAVLAGDALLNYAYEKILSSNNENSLKAGNIIANCAGKDGMIGGQVIDIECENKKEVSIKELDMLHELKTGALLKASCMAGAVLAGANEENIDKMRQIGLKLGLAFQIKDDILDVVSDEATLGKPVGSDNKNNKTTYVTLYGIKKCEEIIKKITDEALCIIDSYGEKGMFLKELSMFLLNRNK